MTVCLATAIHRWNGFSTDAKPSSPEPPEGSTFHCIDTGETYIFHNGMWVFDLRLVRALQSV